MIEEAIPAIKARMPRPSGHTIFVHLDGAKLPTGKGVMEAIQDVAGDDLVLETLTLTRPANSSELNVKGCGCFHSIQQLKEHVGVTNGEELAEVTMEAFNVYPRKALERVRPSLFVACGEVMGCKGDNSYKTPHLGKEKLARAGNL
ncbi:unnamed protein product, partial [Discosporangium mesarthrocarpum]